MAVDDGPEYYRIDKHAERHQRRVYARQMRGQRRAERVGDDDGAGSATRVESPRPRRDKAVRRQHNPHRARLIRQRRHRRHWRMRILGGRVRVP